MTLPDSPTVPFEVVPYSKAKLEQLLVTFSDSSSSIARKLHLDYFEGYFGQIGAQAIIIEHDYVDRDFLEDYAAYYVRCFQPYKRYCRRLHFFRCEVTQESFSKALNGDTDGVPIDTLQEKYLGFVVVKPLPTTVVGRTCLTTYESAGRRYFPIARDYDANLFGISLKIRNTLAFQEQDSVVAACATSALWSVFHGTGKLFQHPIPPPVAITKAAADRLPASTRLLPNHGLNPEMMAHAIRSVGLEPFLLGVSDHYVLKSSAYAYLRGRIPMILGINLFDTSTNPASVMGRHAVAVTGYSLGHASSQPYGATGFRLTASRIDKLYVHDDQVGPFARMEFDGTDVSCKFPNGTIVSQSSISTSWRGSDGAIGSGRAISEILLIPLYHKIRVPFQEIHDGVLHFDSFLSRIGRVQTTPIPDELEWDIYLTTVTDLKEEVIKDLSGDQRPQLLTRSFPKFLWRASAIVGGKPLLDLMFDATDIEQGRCLVTVIERNIEISEFMHEIFADEAVEMIMGQKHRFSASIAGWFRRNPSLK